MVWRGPGAGREVALVHRPRYDDWTLPKGKLKSGEPPVVGACREVWEETGIRVTAGLRLPTVSYPATKGSRVVPKTVDYWAMTVDTDGAFVPGPETDDLAWLPIPAALDRLSYPRDVTVLSAFAALPAVRPPIVVLRPQPDPAAWLARLRCFGPQRLLSAATPRCMRTLEPVAAALRLQVTTHTALAGPPDALVQAIREFAPVPTVVCAPSAALLEALRELTSDALPDPSSQGWVLSLPVRPAEPPVVDPLV